MKDSKNNTLLLLPLILFCSGLIIRKFGWPFGSGLILVSGLWLSLSCLFSAAKKIKTAKSSLSTWSIPEELLFAICFLIVLLRQQYWFYSDGTTSLGLSVLLLLIFFPLIARQSLALSIRLPKSNWPTWLRSMLLVTLSFLIVTTIALNPRQFHNFFRVSTYEEYLRSISNGYETQKANELIYKYTVFSQEEIEKSNRYFHLARENDSLKNYELAIRLYNLAIDKNPENAQAYYYRGLVKLYHLELNNDLAFSCAIDFSESIRLRPHHARSYFLRGVTLSYLDKKEQVCEDMHKAYSLDRSLDVKGYLKKSCPSDSTGLMPINP